MTVDGLGLRVEGLGFGAPDERVGLGFEGLGRPLYGLGLGFRFRYLGDEKLDIVAMQLHVCGHDSVQARLGLGLGFRFKFMFRV